MDPRRYSRYSLRGAGYLAIPMEIGVIKAWHAGALPLSLTITYSVILVAWFVFSIIAFIWPS